MSKMNDYNQLWDRFHTIPTSPNDGSEYVIFPISDNTPHKMGMTSEGYLMLFVECHDATVTTDINLKMFKVNFNQLCHLKENDIKYEKVYSIIQLKTTNTDIKKYFLEVMFLVLKKLPSRPSVKELKSEVSKIISMFTGDSPISKSVIKGLWAELLVIDRSKDKEYLILSWHKSPDDKFDFNDGTDKIEVKCTNNLDRVHQFAIEQLHPNEDAQLLIASCIILNTGVGVSVFDLVDSITAKITNIETILKLKETVMATIGKHFEEVKNMKFDLPYALKQLKWFDYKSVPSIKLCDVPSKVSSVHFSSCLKDIEETDYKTIDSKLFNALG